MTEPTRLTPRYGQPNFDYLARLASTPPEEDGPILMVNLMKYRAVADYTSASGPVRTGREADDEYAPTAILRDIGAQIVFVADVERQLLGVEPKWDRVGVVKYPSRAAFLAMQRRPDFQEKHVHKDAGMERTIVMACTPMLLPEFPPPEPARMAGDDAPFVMMHVLKFAEGGVGGMAAYGASAGAEGLKLGVRPGAFLSVEGTVVGDGREWDEVRFNRFPSHAVFERLIANPTHQAGQGPRTKALTDTYTMMLAPTIDRLTSPLGEQRENSAHESR